MSKKKRSASSVLSTTEAVLHHGIRSEKSVPEINTKAGKGSHQLGGPSIIHSRRAATTTTSQQQARRRDESCGCPLLLPATTCSIVYYPRPFRSHPGPKVLPCSRIRKSGRRRIERSPCLTQRGHEAAQKDSTTNPSSRFRTMTTCLLRRAAAWPSRARSSSWRESDREGGAGEAAAPGPFRIAGLD